MFDTTINSESIALLKSFIERIERLAEQKAAVASDINDIYAEAKSKSFDPKALRKVVSLRKQDQKERQEQQVIVEVYLMHVEGVK